ncbi:MAG: hypothetical protein CL812_00085 [Confluentimicrobium sp.]|nr:hypothetical protein [Actibacterium sp.]|tara:strand:+ start:308 stop:1450 length:1143 start_codon:yes stop_codon:yes gene_type:complete
MRSSEATLINRIPLLLLSLDYPPNDGGISRLGAGLVTTMVGRGLSPRIVSLVDAGKSGIHRPAATHVDVEPARSRRDLQIFCNVRAHLAKYGRDAPILATVWNPEATLALLAGARRVSILAHGNEVMPYLRSGLKGRLRRYVLKRAHVVICNSRFTESLVLDAAPAARTMVVNPGVDATLATRTRAEARSIHNIDATANVILTVARLDAIKGHETVLRALAALPAERRQSFVYVIVGKGDMREALERQANQLGIADLVRFEGFVADSELPEWYAAADAFVLTSVVDPQRRGMEGFGMAFTEAQAAGLAVIGTRSGGIPDAVSEGEGGWLIDERDAEALAGHLRRLNDDPASFRMQGAKGAARVRREMNWTTYTDRILAAI